MRKLISPKLVSYGVAALIAAGAAVPVFAQSNTDGTTNSDVTAKSTTGSSLTGSSSPGKGHHTKHTKKSAAMSDSSNTGTGMSQPATGSNMGDMHNMKTNSSNGG